MMHRLTHNRMTWTLAVVLSAMVLSGIGWLTASLRPYWVARYRGENADLHSALLLFAPLSGADLFSANLSHANLRGADLRQANLSQARLSDAQLEGTKLAGAMLYGTHLRRANLRRADLRGTVLGDADLSGSTLTGAIYDAYTVWPLGFESVMAGAETAGVHLTQSHADRFPRGTALVAHDVRRGRTYFATAAAWESVDCSPDGRQLILRSAFDSYVLDAASLRLLRYLRNSYAWWDGSRLCYLDYYHGFIVRGGQRVRASSGGTTIVAADPEGRYCLGVRMISPGTEQNGRTPTNRLELWEWTETGKPRRRRHLATATYDPGSGGDPRRLAVLDEGVAVFGFMGRGGGALEDLMGIVQNGRITAPLKDRGGRLLEFVRRPLVAGDAIIGLTRTVDPTGATTGDRFFYRVTATSFELRPVAANIVFVTYDAERDAIGWGSVDKDGVSVRYSENEIHLASLPKATGKPRREP